MKFITMNCWCSKIWRAKHWFRRALYSVKINQDTKLINNRNRTREKQQINITQSNLNRSPAVPPVRHLVRTSASKWFMPESKIYSLAPTLSRPSNNDSGNFWIWRFAGFRGFVDRWFMGGRFKRDVLARKELGGLSLFAA